MCIKTAIQALCNKLPIRSGLMQRGETFDDDPLNPDVGAADENTGPIVVTPQAAQAERNEPAASQPEPAAEKQDAAPVPQPKPRGRPRKQTTAAQPPAEEQPPPPEEERPQEGPKDWGDVGF